jgi:fermentation-respiration switch protein FrsA (DUF1100 family)
MFRRRIRVAAAVVAALAGAYIAVVAVLALNQDRFFFHPDTARADLSAARLAGFSAVGLTTADGERLIGWWRPPAPGHGVVLYLHGNSDNLAALAERLRDVAATGAGALAIDYRGFGGSSGHPTEAGLYEDARAAWRFVRDLQPRAPVIIWGESLGTGVAVQLAAEQHVAGVVLDSPYADFRGLIGLRAPWFPSLLVRLRLNSAGKIARIGAPLLIVHCEPDTTIPIVQGRRLYAAAREPKAFVALPDCAHTHIWHGEGKAAILAFLARNGA